MSQGWESHPELLTAEANLHACAYNAAVNHGTQRGVRKMGDLIRALNYYERVCGAARLQFLVNVGVIAEFSPCHDACEIRPGGLFHVDGCENDANHPVYRARRAAAADSLPAKKAIAAEVTLVGVVS